MTDSSDPRRPKSSRKKHSREPATIDLKATVIDDGIAPSSTPGAEARDTLGPDPIGPDTIAAETPSSETISVSETTDVKPDETTLGASELPAEDPAASQQATLDSGIGTDTLPAGASPDEPGRPDATFSDSSFQEAPTSREDTVLPPPAPERRSSAGALIGAGLLGGVIGAGLLYGLQAMQGSPGDSQPVELRLAQLEQRVGALRQPGPPGPVQGNVQALAERVQTLEAARGELDQRLQAVQGSAEQAARQAQEALNRPAPEAPAPAPQNEAALADLGNRLSGLEGQVRTNAESLTNAANAAQGVDGRIADLDRRFADQDRRVSEAERRFTEVERRFADTERRFGEQEQRIAALSQQAAENTRNAETASQTGTRVVLAGRLNDALHSGTPYAEVLDGVRKAGADQARIAALEPFAGSGAPTAAALAKSFEPVETAILRESRGPAEGWTDRILRMADRVVTVRPVNEPGSTGVPALVSRIRQALERDDVMEAAAAWEALPEPARRLSEDWGRQVKAVAQAQQAAQAVATDALATLNRKTQ